MTRLLLAIVCLVFYTGVQADPRADYRQGIAAFQQEDYPRALTHFTRAREQGLELVSLDYNLGSTHFRLGNYRESARHFDKIRQDAKWGALAEYNLGLIAERQNQVDRAVSHYRAAYRRSDAQRVKDMARARLDALDREPPEQRDWSAYLMLAPGYDDNPALIDDSNLDLRREADAFVELIASARGYLVGNRSGGLRATLGYYGRHYADVSEYNISGLSSGLYYDRQLSHWRLSSGLSAGGFWLDGDRFSTDIGLVLQASRPVGDARWQIENHLTQIQAADNFDYLGGLRNRLSNELSGRNGLGRWRLGYRFEYNDRDDLELGDRFFSYSPLRHRFYGRLIKDLSADWSLQATLAHRISRYRDANVDWDPDDEEGFITKTRKENRSDISLALNYALSKTYRSFLEVRHTNNSANIDRFSYRSNQISLGVDALF